MEKQFSQKWMASVSGTANAPALCLQPEAASFADANLCGTSLLDTQNPGDTRQNSGDPSLSGVVVSLPLTSTRARAFAAMAAVTPLHSAC